MSRQHSLCCRTWGLPECVIYAKPRTSPRLLPGSRDNGSRGSSWRCWGRHSWDGRAFSSLLVVVGVPTDFLAGADEKPPHPAAHAPSPAKTVKMTCVFSMAPTPLQAAMRAKPTDRLSAPLSATVQASLFYLPCTIS